MQNWQDYEADYYGRVPDGRYGRSMQGSRPGWLPPYPEDRPDTWYGGEDRPDAWYGDEGMPDIQYGDESGPGMQRDGRWNRGGMPMEDNWRMPMERNGQRRPMNRRSEEDNRARSRMDGQNRMDGQKRIDERDWENDGIWDDLDEFEGLYGELAMLILRRIREICDSMDGEGCIAMEGHLDREMLEMIVERVLERLEDEPEWSGDWMWDGQMQDGQMQASQIQGGQMRNAQGMMLADQMGGMDQSEETAAQPSVPVIGRGGPCAGPGRSLIEVLICQELLRRRVRRRRRRRRWDR